MKCLNRNKTKFYYSLYKSKEPVVDEYGNNTGEYNIIYTEPIECYGNISAASGETETRVFGENVLYDKIIVLDKNPGIDEYSVLWIDIPPYIDDIEMSYDYVVRKVAESLNSASIAISKVSVS